MSLEGVKNALRGTALEEAIMALPHTGATVTLAADAIGCDPDQIAKTMSFLVGDAPVLIVVSGSSRIDNKKYKSFFHKKAKMIPHEEVEALIGHPPGGVGPFGAKDGVAVYFDRSLRHYELFYPAAGDIDHVVRMTVKDACEILGIEEFIDVTQDGEVQP